MYYLWWTMRVNSYFLLLTLILAGTASAQTSVHVTDSIWIDSINTHSGQESVLSVYFVNADTLTALDLPLSYGYSDFIIDSVSFVNSRLEGIISTIVVITPDSALLHIGAIMLNLTDQEIVPGRGLLARIYITVPDDYPAREIDFDTTYIRTSLTFVPSDHRDSYTPVFRKGVVINTFSPATQDSLWVANQHIQAGQSFVVPLYAFNGLNITSARIPLQYHSDNIVFDSLSVVGTRSADAALVQTDDNPVAREVLISLNYTETNPLTPRSGSLANLYFTCILGGTTTSTLIDTTIINGVPLNCRLGKVFGYVQIFPDFQSGKLTISTVSDANDGNSAIPLEFALKQNEPNPFNPTTTISFSLPEKSHVRLIVYNVLGQHVRTLVDQTLQAGQHDVIFDSRDDNGRELASGIYLYHINTDKNSQTRKMALIK